MEGNLITYKFSKKQIEDYIKKTLNTLDAKFDSEAKRVN